MDKNKKIRDFKKDDKVYVVDYWGSTEGPRAYQAQATIISVDNEKKQFLAVLYGDTYQSYSFNDYGFIVFDTEEEAYDAAVKIPNPKTSIYQIIGKRIYEKKVKGIIGSHAYSNDGSFKLVIHVNKGKNIPIEELGKTVFTTRLLAELKLKGKK